MGVLEAYRSCLIEQLLESKKVKVEGLGTFYVTIANKEGGIKNLTDFNIGTIAQGLRLRFLPDASQEENLSSKEFLKKARFIDVATLTKDKTVEDEEETSPAPSEGGENGSGTNTGGTSPNPSEGGENGGGGETPDPENPGGGGDGGSGDDEN